MTSINQPTNYSKTSHFKGLPKNIQEITAIENNDKLFLSPHVWTQPFQILELGVMFRNKQEK